MKKIILSTIMELIAIFIIISIHKFRFGNIDTSSYIVGSLVGIIIVKGHHYRDRRGKNE